jgi:hypothetical protein
VVQDHVVGVGDIVLARRPEEGAVAGTAEIAIVVSAACRESGKAVVVDTLG